MLEDVKIKRRYRLTNRQIKALDTKQKIYNAALVEIQNKGYLNVSIGDITEAAGVAKGSFYTHFDSKESILRYTYDQLNPIYLHAYNQVKDLDFLNSICQFIRLSFAELEKLGREILRAMATNYHSEEFIGVYLDHERQIYKCLDMIISAGKINGVLSEEIPTKQYVRIIFSVLIGVENCWCLMTEDEMSLADFAVQNVRMVAMGMMDDARERKGL